jgi:exonuclease III
MQGLEGPNEGTATNPSEGPESSMTGEEQEFAHTLHADDGREDVSNGFSGERNTPQTDDLDILGDLPEVDMEEIARNCGLGDFDSILREIERRDQLVEPGPPDAQTTNTQPRHHLPPAEGGETNQRASNVQNSQRRQNRSDGRAPPTNRAPRRQKTRSAKQKAAREERRKSLMGIFDSEATAATRSPDEQEGDPEAEARKRAKKRARKAKQTRNTRHGGVQIATLNIKGYGNDNPLHHDNKWHHINQLMRDKRIGILAVQEAHMTEERRAKVQEVYSRRLKIFASADPEKPTAQAGVAVVFNNDVITDTGAKAEELIPGRVMLATFKLRGGTEVRALALYAYNDAMQNANLWRDLREVYEKDNNLKKPDIILGDFNMVEDAIDRLPAHDDRASTVAAMLDLKECLNLTDGWRATFPDTIQFSYMQGNSIHSRIDRIYVTPHILSTSVQWNIEPSGIPNCDHDMASTVLTDPEMPRFGKGRRTIPEYLLKDKIFVQEVIQMGSKASSEIRTISDLGNRTKERNAQIIYAQLKTEIQERARTRNNEIVPKIAEEENETRYELKALSEDATLPEEEKATKTSTLRKRLRRLAEKRHGKRRSSLKIKHRLEGESMTKSFAAMGKEKKPRDIIWGLKSNVNLAGQPVIERDSMRMAYIARDYHENLQRDGIKEGEEIESERELKIQHALSLIDTSPTNEQKEALGDLMTTDEVEEALKAAENGSSAGLDGITFEIWKHFEKIHSLRPEDSTEETFPVVDILTEVFNDVWIHGVENPDFAEGWMCPIYKKGDRELISNFRPITLLNTDYKLFTKVLSTRISKVASTLIHSAQAGFIPERQISDHTQLTRLVMEHAEAAGINGLIVALDQEKAYDKIAHDYLWRALEAFGIPEAFTQAVRSLYENAETAVCINGEMSDKWTITRGVRQGDPLSCILFDLAIEPLALALRKSDLKGIDVPGQSERLIATLFADDTTVYLSKEDEISKLEAILEDWCTAARAKFNVSKTVVMPIGELTYRQSVLQTRKTQSDGGQIPANMTILREGEATRILGAWYGNGVDISAPWSIVLTKLTKSMERWSNASVNLLYKRHVIQCTAGGYSQYLAQVQGCPTRVETEIERQITKYLWEGKMSKVNKETTHAPIDQGGMKILDIKARNEAIRLIWLKRYLDTSAARPLWASFADALLARNVPASEERIDEKMRQNPLLQTWSTFRGYQRRVCPFIRELISTAENYGMRLEALDVPQSTADMMPIWLHKQADQRARRLALSKEAVCLRENHEIRTTGEMRRFAAKANQPGHKKRKNCTCDACKLARTAHQCSAPSACIEKANEIISTLPEKWNPLSEHPNQPEMMIYTEEADEQRKNGIRGPGKAEPVLFERFPEPKNPSVNDALRVFTTGKTPQTNLTRRTIAENQGPQRVTIHTFCANAGERDAKATAGIVYSTGNPRNTTISVPNNHPQNAITAALLAVAHVAQTEDEERNLVIESWIPALRDELIHKLAEHEDTGYIGRKHPYMTRLAVARLRKRTATTILVSPEHREASERAVEAEALAKAAQKSDFTNPRGLEIAIRDDEPQLTGAKLSALTQKLAYQGVREILMQKYNKRPRTEAMMQRAQAEAEDAFGSVPTEDQMWKSMRHKDLSRECRHFLYRLMHDSYMVGSHWDRPSFNDELQARKNCRHQHCGGEESLEHILFYCEAPGREKVWKLAKALWEKKNQTKQLWPGIGMVISCGLARFKTPNGERDYGAERLYRILVSESAKLIWNLRLERVIPGKDETQTDAEIEARWYKTMNARLSLDRELSNKRKYGKKAIKKRYVLDTWAGTLEREEELPRDWAREGGVLVGIRFGLGDEVREEEEDVT